MNLKKKLATPAELVKSARNIFRENQTEFGIRFGKSQSLISKYERGEVEPPGEMIIQIMTIVGDASSLDKLTPERLAQEVGRLSNTHATLALRRAIGDLLELGRIVPAVTHA